MFNVPKKTFQPLMTTNNKRTQAGMYYDAVRKLGERDRHVMDMLNHPTNPLTKDDLVKLAKRFPERWGRYANIARTKN